MFISFCIITTGENTEKTNLCIQSIHNNFISNSQYEIIIVGNNLNSFKNKNCNLIEDTEFIEFLGKRKNIAFENSKGDIIVHCDDDIIFSLDWFENFKKFNEENTDWQIMGNKILLPDSSRYWDRAIYFPLHHMVDYNHKSNSDVYYQTGCFSICKRELLEKIKWDNNIPYYGTSKGFKYNEDIDFSLRLNNEKIKIHFDQNNTVWHYDYTYSSDGIICNKKRYIDHAEYKCLNFIKLLNDLKSKKKVTTVLQGGLGNTLFQIATTYAYSLNHNFQFEIYDNLHIPCHHPPLDSYKGNIFSNIKISTGDGDYCRYDEPSFCYNEIPKINQNILLFGYFQSEKYFQKYEKEIKKLFNFNSNLVNKYSSELNIKNCSIHVRRGDYLNLQNCHPIPSLQYYREAVSLFDKDTLFFVFSNDIEWCKKELSHKTIGTENIIFIDGNSGQDDLLLMSRCQNNIIANSSFSWWGAWLNQNSNKKIVCPKNWFSEHYAKKICGENYKNYNQDLIPKQWIQL